ncbi:hydantoinase B/oxoprolinase family protein [Synechococcus sp. CS-1324]|uniref:hydantoinase B/oxoprolinase family protein n=1 Tax=Synechococcus sp. CS-1324 TaxID=2847980 RepID=UPI000DB40533|nr:hydantoinase B/oxoprolinase family protein [Synechococcus sp. CS-1324]MCT0230768.1 hydantoinase B/oxoprolinase family protein [Synechococcus sp. CS-1324]PZV05901.1 MAG: 5-oxoprolinase [Cyanobium sp.]
MAGGWRFWIDRGGTFTDLVGQGPGGEQVVRKVLSEQPGRLADPAVMAMRQVLGLAGDAPIPAGAIEAVRLGTTVATNALLERRGSPTLLLITAGFADALRIGDQHRPDLFALRIQTVAPLFSQVIEVGGRLAADGKELEPLRLDADLERGLHQALERGLRSCAVVLLHAARHPRHELALGSWLARFGFEQLSLSHAVAAQSRLVPRGQTTVVEAFVGPALGTYLAQLRSALGDGCRLEVMQSSGGLISPDRLRAKDTILSGPAGGMVGAVRVAAAAAAAAVGCSPAVGGRPAAAEAIVGFDMGGTSTDVFHFDPAGPDGGWERCVETEINGVSLQAPMLPIHTVAAGGGSKIQFDGLRLQVGPASAGADPGPACYRLGGPLTVTDANLLLGRLQPACFPALFGPGRNQCLDVAVVRQEFELLAARIHAATGLPQVSERLAEGALAIAVDRMAEAIRRISIQRGHDIRNSTLVCFGGAGGQHACAVAAQLGISRLLLHPLAGVLSAYGIGLADRRLLRERVVREPLDAALLPRLAAMAAELAVPGSGSIVRISLELRFGGSEVCLSVPFASLEAIGEAFQASHRRRYGYLPVATAGEPLALVVERLLVEQVEANDTPVVAGAPTGSGSRAESAFVALFLEGRWQTVPLWERHQLAAGARLSGPALIVEATGTNLLAEGWQADLLPGGELLFSHTAAAAPASTHPSGPQNGVDPVSLELFHHRFAAIAEQMGVRLQQSARSVNIRERLDFSCAVFDGEGGLVANAPHIPVHLGSMGDSVASLLAAIRRGERLPLGPGDVVVSNNPYNGGTHLPDLTAITPVFCGGEPLFVACRGHHADVGGLTPGSMPPFSRQLSEEGLLLDNIPLLRGGVLLEVEWRQRLMAGNQPVRNPDQLLADLRAQVAANQLGAELLLALSEREGGARVRAFMAHVQDNGAEAVRRLIDRLVGGRFSLPLDGGLVIQLEVEIDRQRRRARIDFSGTSPQDAGNRNAPLAITKAVVLYVVRCLVGEAIPLNAGCFRPLELVVPEGCLLHPRPPAAVVAGNVETSQAIANALFGALGVLAAAQGTMNNLSFGNDSCQYYETICGGTGAGILADGTGFGGAAAVQSHMTNSRLTDPEILEQRFPVRLESFAVRTGSGGQGRWAGGDGVVRQLCFLEPMTVAILSGSRQVAPFGLAGGGPGAVGHNRLVRQAGGEQQLGGSAQLLVNPGDRLVIETPGGGGYGQA